MCGAPLSPSIQVLGHPAGSEVSAGRQTDPAQVNACCTSATAIGEVHVRIIILVD